MIFGLPDTLTNFHAVHVTNENAMAEPTSFGPYINSQSQKQVKHKKYGLKPCCSKGKDEMNEYGSRYKKLKHKK